MLSDSLHKQRKYSPPKRAVTAKGQQFSDLQKTELVKLWLVTGNLTQAAVALGIGHETAKRWKASAWWKELADDLRAESHLKLSGKLKAIVEKSLAITEDRLERGDFVVNPKTGEVTRRQVSLKDAHRVAVDLMDRHLKLDAKPVEEEENKKVLDRLEQLKQTFERFAGKKPAVVEVTDVYFAKEITNAVHDKREERLQEGEGVGVSPRQRSEAEGQGGSPRSQTIGGEVDREFAVE